MLCVSRAPCMSVGVCVCPQYTVPSASGLLQALVLGLTSGRRRLGGLRQTLVTGCLDALQQALA